MSRLPLWLGASFVFLVSVSASLPDLVKDFSLTFRQPLHRIVVWYAGLQGRDELLSSWILSGIAVSEEKYSLTRYSIHVTELFREPSFTLKTLK